MRRNNLFCQSIDSVEGARRHRHALTLVVFAKPGSARTALDAAERMAVLLDDADLALAGHALVFLRLTRIASTRDEQTGEARTILAFEAVTEVAA
ncbi:tail completion protein gp17 [Methylorubrum zatmanii]